MFDTTKTLNEKEMAIEGKTLKEKAAILAETTRLADKTFKEQLDLANNHAGKILGLDKLIEEKDGRKVTAAIEQMAADEKTRIRLLEIITERRLNLGEIADLERGLAKERAEASKTDMGAQERATELARLRSKQNRDAMKLEEEQAKALNSAVFKTEEERTAFIADQEKVRNAEREKAIKQT